MRDKRDVILEFHSSPDAILNALHQEGYVIAARPTTPPATMADTVARADMSVDEKDAATIEQLDVAREAITAALRTMPNHVGSTFNPRADVPALQRAHREVVGVVAFAKLKREGAV